VLNEQRLTDVSGDLAGSLIVIDGKALRTRQITNSFGLVEVPGYSGVPVLVNHQVVGETDPNGNFAMPSLLPYDNNVISIDPSSLPVSANIASTDMVTVPTRGGAVIVRFPTRNAGGVLITVIGSDGVPLPAGTLISDQRARTWPVAKAGQAYLAGLAPGKEKLQAVRGSIPCDFEVNVPSDVLDMPDLGKFVCVDEVVTR